MLLYRERLHAPISWWLTTGGCVIILGSTLWAGFSVTIGLGVYLVMGGILAGALLSWGSVRITVTGSELVVGRERLPISQVSEASAMDVEQTTALRGPSADPAAYLLIRPYVKRSAFVGVTQPASRPYWLVATRRPAQLVAAVEDARVRAGKDPAWDDDEPGEHAAANGKDANAR